MYVSGGENEEEPLWEVNHTPKANIEIETGDNSAKVEFPKYREKKRVEKLLKFLLVILRLLFELVRNPLLRLDDLRSKLVWRLRSKK